MGHITHNNVGIININLHGARSFLSRYRTRNSPSIEVFQVLVKTKTALWMQRVKSHLSRDFTDTISRGRARTLKISCIEFIVGRIHRGVENIVGRKLSST